MAGDETKPSVVADAHAEVCIQSGVEEASDHK